jgi:acetylornithine deacetylase/succinyl-diaminopimelate desuccinylase-like protein
MTTNEDLNRLAGDLEESCRIDPENTLRDIAGEVADELRKMAERQEEVAKREISHLEAIVHGQVAYSTKEDLVRYVLANADPEDVAKIGGMLAGQSIHRAMTGVYREL